MRIIFAGTTEFGIPTLEKLMQDKHELLFVITQPDKPVGRKQRLSPSPIKLWAQKNNIRVEQPEKISQLATQISNLNPDILLVAAYGQIIPKDILDLPKYKSVNIHGSILPKYRGASPIQASLLAGDKETGITYIVMDEKMDHGPIIATKNLSIAPNDDFPTLYKKFSELAGQSTSEVLSKYISGQLKPISQNHGQATFTKLLKKEDGKILWSNPSVEIYNQIRGLNPEPGTWTTLDNKIVKVLKVKPFSDFKVELPGKLYQTPDGIAIKTSDQSLLLLEVQPEGKKPMSGKDFFNGLQNKQNVFFK